MEFSYSFALMRQYLAWFNLTLEAVCCASVPVKYLALNRLCCQKLLGCKGFALRCLYLCSLLRGWRPLRFEVPFGTALLFGLRCWFSRFGSQPAPVVGLAGCLEFSDPYTPIPINTTNALIGWALGLRQLARSLAPVFARLMRRRMYGSAAFSDHVSRTLPNRRRTARFSSLMCRPSSEAHRYGRHPTRQRTSDL